MCILKRKLTSTEVDEVIEEATKDSLVIYYLNTSELKYVIASINIIYPPYFQCPGDGQNDYV